MYVKLNCIEDCMNYGLPTAYLSNKNPIEISPIVGEGQWGMGWELSTYPEVEVSLSGQLNSWFIPTAGVSVC